MFGKRYLLSNEAILGIYVKFQGVSIISSKIINWLSFFRSSNITFFFGAFLVFSLWVCRTWGIRAFGAEVRMCMCLFSGREMPSPFELSFQYILRCSLYKHRPHGHSPTCLTLGCILYVHQTASLWFQLSCQGWVLHFHDKVTHKTSHQMSLVTSHHGINLAIRVP